MTEMLRQMPVKKQNGSCIVDNENRMKVQCHLHVGEDIGIQRRHPAEVCFTPMPIWDGDLSFLTFNGIECDIVSSNLNSHRYMNMI